MPTLYVENVPEELYEAIRQRAKSEPGANGIVAFTGFLDRSIRRAHRFRAGTRRWF